MKQHCLATIIIGVLFIFSNALLGSSQLNSSGPTGFLPTHPQLKKSDKGSVPAPKGKEVTVGNVTVYENSIYQRNSTSMLVTVYDIFGFHPHVKYISDRLAESGFLVVIPDLFHGNPVPLENFPQPNFTERAQHLFAKNGSWVENRSDLQHVIKYYEKNHGIKGVGMFGFCWGGKLSVYAASDENFNSLKAIGLVHPSRVTLSDANGIKVHTIALPSKAEENMGPFVDIVNKNVKTKASEHFRYDKMPHGFAGARSDFSDPRKRGKMLKM